MTYMLRHDFQRKYSKAV